VNRRPTSARCAWLVALLLAVLGAGAAPAAAAGATKLVVYHGYRFRVPASWPVYELGRRPATCVRFDRHAVYLGAPGAAESCPATVLGRTEAILVRPAGTAAAALGGEDTLRMSVPHHDGLVVTATWRSDPAVIRRTLGIRSLTAHEPRIALATRADATRATTSRPVANAAATTFTGTGFDACEDPSLTQLTAWLSSTYRAVGTYIGGANMGCSQPNLSTTYASDAVALGWHLIPTYVGLQAPTNSCGCASITKGQAAAEGTSAAESAVADAEAIGIGAGNPIYDDMEAYPTGGSNTTTVMTYLSAWTVELHALGYLSGVYSSTDSGIHDLVAAYGTGVYTVPDALWNADWNNEQSTADPAIPSAEWTNHQRLHQYAGGHNETHGGVKINIDGDYVDGATVGTGNVSAPPSTPTLSIAPKPDGSIELSGSYPGGVGVSAWRLLGGASPTALAPLTGALTGSAIVSHSAFTYFSEQALNAAGQVLAATPVTATPPHIVIYGHSVFAPATGWAGLPVGCFASAACRIATRITSGRTVVASSKPERVAAGGSGIVYVTLTSAGRALLRTAPGHRLSVNVTATDAVAKAQVAMTMIPFVTSGRGPARSAVPSPAIKLIGYTDFVNGSGVGGILAGCFGAAPCSVAAAIASGHTLLAITGPEFIGANELGYLSFRLTAAGRQLLSSATGNQLAAQVKLADGSYGSATADIALVRF
jgi:hypothetical protein